MIKTALLAAAAVTTVAGFAAPAQAQWQTCTWNGAPLNCVVDHTANGEGWTISFENGARNIYWLPTNEARVTNQNGLDRSELMRHVFMTHGQGLTAIDQNGGVLKAPFRL